MYKKIKNVLKTLISRKLLYKYEYFFRFFYYLCFIGNKFKCNVCNKKLRKFVKLSDNDKLCPYCGSISRNRRLWDILENNYLTENIKILDFSPSRNLFRLLKKKYSDNYVSTDLSGNFFSDKKYDITKIETEDEYFDLIICYHILEHIENDIAAIKELYRVLKKNGTCLIQTPFKTGEIYENDAIKSKNERLIHFGQEDHVRIYSLESLINRLLACNFQTKSLIFSENCNNKNGFNTDETILVCKKK